MVRLDLKQSKIVVSPGAQDIPEILALAFSVSILYLLCTPYKPKRSKESAPASHLSSSGDISPMIFAAGFLSTTVPTNVYLKTRLGSDFCYVGGDDGDDPCYDFSDDLACDVNQGPGYEGNDCSAFDGDGGIAGTDGGGCVGGEDGGACIGGDDGGGACVGGDDGGGGCGSGGGCGGDGGCGGGCGGGGGGRCGGGGCGGGCRGGCGGGGCGG